MASEDRHSLAPWQRIPTLLFLAASLAYLLVGYRVALTDMGYAQASAAIGSRLQPWFWAAQFHMFNEPRPYVSLIQASLKTDHGQVSVDLPALYPTLREEGPSYARSRFYSNHERVGLMAQDICRRLGGQEVQIWLEQQSKLKTTPPVKTSLGSWPCEPAP